MRNLKHTIAAVVAVSLVGTLAAAQAVNFSAARANELTQETESAEVVPAVLTGDGEGITAEFTISPMRQMFVGKDGYILTSGGSINLRAAADTESTILNVLNIGTQVKITDTDEDWFQIEAGEYTGYVKSEFVTLDYEAVKKQLLASVMYQSGTAAKSINVRGEARDDAVILSQIGEGEKVTVLETTDNGWHKVYFGDNYDIGYVSAEYINVGDMVERKEVDEKRAAKIAAVTKKAKITETSNVKLLPSEESETLATIEKNTECKIISGGTNWTKIIVPSTNEIGYVRTANISEIVPVVAANTQKTSEKTDKASQTSKNTTTEAASSGNGSALVAQAAKYIGTRYVYGGTSPSGFDCSGLVQYSLRKLGVSIGRSSGAQYNSGTAVSRSNLKPGDLVFFSRGKGISHVAIYAGNGQVIHAPRAGKSVCYQSLSSLTESLNYVGAKRVL